ncbi:nuclear transport factor 2 family protein [Sphingobium mellinum]|uniref:nuclear transport factor 2 family protein n=1 Tax=Sphingobium mellinum TaxID=1387166 RepID=UPI0030EC8699
MSLTLAELLRSDDAPHDDPTLRRAAKVAVARFYAAIGRRDMDALRHALTPDAVYEFPFSESGSSDPSECRRFTGADAIIAFWQDTLSRDMRFGALEDVDLSILADGSRLFIEQRGDITLADGTSYRNRYIFRYDIRDGRIAHVREYINPVISARAFGRPLGPTRCFEQE